MKIKITFLIVMGMVAWHSTLAQDNKNVVSADKMQEIYSEVKTAL